MSRLGQFNILLTELQLRSVNVLERPCPEDLEKREIIAQVTMPTPWISSMVVVPKKNGKFCICLDPIDLNRALQRENYPMPTIEESFPSSRS